MKLSDLVRLCGAHDPEIRVWNLSDQTGDEVERAVLELFYLAPDPTLVLEPRR